MSKSNTAKEIAAQPGLWKETCDIVISQKNEIASFLEKTLKHDNLNVILTGAGTSAYIGDALHTSFQRKFGRNTAAVETTDIVSHPKDYFFKDQPTLLVSFARSGDSPESVASVELANQYCDTIYHLYITCNENGSLAKNADTNNSHVILMPAAANDTALAMTGSFTTMLLAGNLVCDLDNLNQNEKYVDQLVKYGEKIISDFDSKIEEVAQLDFNRVVFLGSGTLKGIARESHLKVQELSDGQVICKFDTFLGLRHGPKAVIKEQTLVVYLLSGDDFVNLYEYDLVRSINVQKEKLYEIGIGQHIQKKDDITLDLSIELADANIIPEEFFAVCAILPGQLLGLYKSINLGLSPDSPSVNKSINRVVQGVTIYK